MSTVRIMRVLLVRLGSGEGNVDITINAIAREMRESGMEVIYAGSNQAPEQIVETAIQEDVDAIGIVILNEKQHITSIQRVVELLSEDDAEDIVVMVVSNIPELDHLELEKIGVCGIFGVENDPAEMVEFITDNVRMVER